MPESKKPIVTTSLPDPIELAKETWVIYKKRFWTFAGIGLLGTLGVILLAMITAALGAGSFFGFGAKVSTPVITTFIILGVLLVIAMLVLTSWTRAAQLIAIRDWKEKSGIRENLDKAKPYILPLLLTSLLSGLIVFGTVFLFFIPAILFGIWFTFAPFIVTVENRSGLAALHTSRELIRGRFWQILWRVIAIHLPEIVLSLFLTSTSQQGSGELRGLLQLLSLLAIPFYEAYTFVLFQKLRDVKGEIPAIVPTGSKFVYLLIPLIGFLLVLMGSIFVVPQLAKTLQQVGKQAASQVQSGDTSTSGSLKIKPGTAILTGLTQYYITNQKFPQELSELKGMIGLSEIPNEPITGLPYRYEVLKDGQDFRLCTPITVKPEKCVTTQSQDFDL